LKYSRSTPPTAKSTTSPSAAATGAPLSPPRPHTLVPLAPPPAPSADPLPPLTSLTSNLPVQVRGAQAARVRDPARPDHLGPSERNARLPRCGLPLLSDSVVGLHPPFCSFVYSLQLDRMYPLTTRPARAPCVGFVPPLSPPSCVRPLHSSRYPERHSAPLRKRVPHFIRRHCW